MTKRHPEIKRMSQELLDWHIAHMEYPNHPHGSLKEGLGMYSYENIGKYIQLQEDNELIPDKELYCEKCWNTWIVEVYNIADGTRKRKCRCWSSQEQKQSKLDIEKIDRIDEAFKYYYEWENLYAFEECKEADRRVFREAILRYQPECYNCKMNKIAMKSAEE